MTSWLHKLAPALAGFFYGGWAGYANWEHGWPASVAAFGVQGGFALSSTWLLGWLLFRSMSFYGKRSPSSRLRDVASYATCSVFLIAVPLVLHLLAGTPEILMAMLPGLIIGHIYLFVLTRHTSRTLR